jgi:phosphatidylglycerophosphate synthase
MLSHTAPPRPHRTGVRDTRDAHAALRRDAAFAMACTGLGLVAAAAGVTVGAGMGAWFVPKAIAVFGVASALVWRALPMHAPQRRFGAANGITLLRLALVALLAAGVGEPALQTPLLAWCVVVLATVDALLDAADGAIARRRGQASDFGARFDMETDALLIAVLSVLVLALDKAGAWVLAAGAMRYAFVLAAVAWPWLAAPLPPSVRRKTVCVVQIVTLIICLAPIVTPRWAGMIAGAGLAALVYSFGADILGLARRRPRP